MGGSADSEMIMDQTLQQRIKLRVGRHVQTYSLLKYRCYLDSALWSEVCWCPTRQQVGLSHLVLLSLLSLQ